MREIYEGQIVLSAGPNVTAQFIGDNWDRLYERMTVHMRRKMPRSEYLDKVDDHAMNWIEKIIQRDGLRSRIEDGRSIAPSQVAGWARKAAYTEIRNEGREPVCRVFHGALTPPEVKAFAEIDWTEVVIPRTINESEQICHNQYAAHSEDDYISDAIESLADDHPTTQVEQTVVGFDAMDAVLDQISDIIADEISEEFDPEFHRQLITDRFVKEMSIREIAAEHGLDFEKDQNRIKVAISRVRDVMLRHRDDGAFDEFLTR